VQLDETRCRSPEEFKAWSQNLGHEGVLTTFYSYGTVAPRRQGRDHQGSGDAGQPQRSTPAMVTHAASASRSFATYSTSEQRHPHPTACVKRVMSPRLLCPRRACQTKVSRVRSPRKGRDMRKSRFTDEQIVGTRAAAEDQGHLLLAFNMRASRAQLDPT
jgi:hypothetical protein